ncbi:MAG: molybdopterin biosynthesis protein MoeE [Candidatus Marinimicrobia bacterium]|nr:molybdopterin biosynthesis protein MoeE [Candidatus Neomarinimicrobiota bacterium]|tara:strand:- start:152 stop:568 length:417 start_codon:yes stop_codon:yes gene_type:complete
MMVHVEIVNSPIEFFTHDDGRLQDGAELMFNGHVRDTEHGSKIKSLEYEQYDGMAKAELLQLAENTVKKFPINDLFCKHCIGKVDVGDTSLHVVIWSKHRKEGLDAMSWFISELKNSVPIWKWAILEDGSRVPTECKD